MDLGQGCVSGDWQAYLASRVAKKFTVIQLSVPQAWMKDPLKDCSKQAPFVGNSWAQWNPVFWKSFEEKVQSANSQGLVVVVVGMMEPAYQYAAGALPDSLRYPSLSLAKAFARNLAARLAGNFVIFSPGFDTKPDTASRRNLIRGVGAEIANTVPKHLVTNHFGGSTLSAVAGTAYDDYQDYHLASESWLKFQLMQSGQCRNTSGVTAACAGLIEELDVQRCNFTNRARQMALDVRSFTAKKPLANGETIYDWDGVSARPSDLYSAYRVRQTGWLSLLSGGFGYTQGVQGLWEWGRGSPIGVGVRLPSGSWTQPSSDQAFFRGNLLRSLRWERMEPVHSIIANQPTATTQSPTPVEHLKIVASRDVSLRYTLAYLPDNPHPSLSNTVAIQLGIRLSFYPDFLTPRWRKEFHDPRNGQAAGLATGPQLVGGTAQIPIYEFRQGSCAPGPECEGQNGARDWVLVLTDTSPGQPLWTTNPNLNRFQVWPYFDVEEGVWNIQGQLYDASGASLGGDIGLTTPTKAMQRLPVVVREGGGSFLVVWEAEEGDGDGSGIFGRFVSATGEPQGAELQVSDDFEGDQATPAVTADAAGGFVVAWTAPDGDGTGVFAQRFSAAARVGASFRVNQGTAGNQSSPQLSTDPTGCFVVAWESDGGGGSEVGVQARRFFASGLAESGDEAVGVNTGSFFAVQRVEMDGAGNYQVYWQRFVDGESQGHYSRRFDRLSGSMESESLVSAPEG